MIYLAPMQGLTHLPFRKAFASVFPHSIDYAVSPFLSLTHGTVSADCKKLKEVLPENNSQALPLIPQILGNEADLFVEMANVLYDLGYEEINWNLGCPMPRVSKKRRGSGLLCHPDEIDRFLEFVLPKIQPQLSIKMRLGYHCPDEIEALIPILNKSKLTNVIMHPRIGMQLYEGDLHWQQFRWFMSEIQHPVVFNGNIFTIENDVFLQTNFPQIKDVMLGRGLLYNIFLADELRGNSEKDFSLFFRFEENLLSEIGEIASTEGGVLNRMKEYWFYFSSMFANSEEILSRIVHAKSLQDFRKIIEDLKAYPL